MTFIDKNKLFKIYIHTSGFYHTVSTIIQTHGHTFPNEMAAAGYMAVPAKCSNLPYIIRHQVVLLRRSSSRWAFLAISSSTSKVSTPTLSSSWRTCASSNSSLAVVSPQQLPPR